MAFRTLAPSLVPGSSGEGPLLARFTVPTQNQTQGAPIPTSYTPPTFTSLPLGILILISHHLDITSALSLSRVLRQCASAAQWRIWRDIHLSEPARLKGVAGKAEEGVGDSALAEKLRLMMDQGNDEQWGMVRSINMYCSASKADSTLSLISRASPNLRSLILERSAHSTDPTGLDRLWLSSYPHLPFPALTHITLGTKMVQTLNLLPLLCRQCPNLSTLDLSYNSMNPSRILTDDTDPSLDPNPQIHLVDRNTKIQVFRLSYNHIPQFKDDRDDPLPTIVSFLTHSPHLRQLYLLFVRSRVREIHTVGTAIATLPDLQDMYIAADDFNQLGGVGLYLVPPALSMKRLVIPCRTGAGSKLMRSSFPRLETVFMVPFGYDRSLRRTKSGPYHAEEDTLDWLKSPTLKTLQDLFTLQPRTATWLRQNPNLSKIYVSHSIAGIECLEVFETMDEIEAAGIVSVNVGSITYGEEELLVLRMMMQGVDDDTGETWQVDYYGRRYRTVLCPVRCDVGDGRPCSPSTQVRIQPIGRVITDWDGRAVPVEVLDRFREVEGLKGDLWARRGVRVGKDAWKVMIDWRDGLD